MTENPFINPKLLGICPKCKEKEQVTKESRKTKEGYTRRRKECRACGHRATTYEVDDVFYTQANAMFATFQNLFKLLKEPKDKLSCDQCVHNRHSACSYEFPEFGTPEAVDCIFFESNR